MEERIYRLLLRLYPPRFRSEFEEEMLADYRARRDEPRHHGPRGKVRLWGFLLRDLLRAVPWLTMDDVRREDGMYGIGQLAQDGRFALRVFRRRPGFALAILVILGVGIGGSTTMFSVTDRILIRPLPYRTAGTLVQIGGVYESSPGRLTSVTPHEVLSWQERLRETAVAASRLQLVTVRRDGDRSELLSAAGVSASFLPMLGVEAWRGRLFGPAEDRVDAPRVAILTHGAWSRRWGSDPDVVGGTVHVDDQEVTIVGILPPDFVPPSALHHGDVELYFPVSRIRDPFGPTVTDDAFLQVLGAVRPGVSLEAARQELDAVETEVLRLAGMDPAGRDVGMEPLHERTVEGFDRVLAPFIGAVLFILLLACANVANLFLVRATERERELRVRMALGADRRRLARQLLTEGLALALAAGLFGSILAWGGAAAFRRFAPPDIPRLLEVGVDLRALGFALVLAVVTGVAFSLVPVLGTLRPGAGRTGPVEGPGRSGGAGPGSTRIRSALVVGEVALALVLFSGATALTVSLLHLSRTDLGFDPTEVVFVSPWVPQDARDTPEERIALYRALLERIRTVPGVVAAGATNNLPLTPNRSVRTVTIDGVERGDGEGVDVSWHQVLPGFFEALRVPVLAGRAFRETDDGRDGMPVIVNESMARAYWPDGQAVGGRLRMGPPSAPDPQWMEVVGVVADIRQQGATAPPEPAFYLSWSALPSAAHLSVVVRGGGDVEALVDPLRSAVAAALPGVPVRRAGTMSSLQDELAVTPRFHAMVLGGFAGVSLLLALAGVYGTLAYTVRQRTRELGVRMALGAARSRVRGMVLVRGMRLAAAGLLAGIVLSLLSAGALDGLVYGVEPTDPRVLAGAAAALALAATLASWIPAARATRISPTEALRIE